MVMFTAPAAVALLMEYMKTYKNGYRVMMHKATRSIYVNPLNTLSAILSLVISLTTFARIK